ncbi:hypothetical protein P20429_3249 [Pseudoalteromonas sp. BSi20429]|uniref:Uncharacterized protein n=1 Tax=Pseudoalteromonas arctica A 37-1-2 TaxID=1117313 RepID=A0A290S6S1_9GAMM|nr:hypothetical protein PARC_a3380 [Pseudoalteromonas arctica A 37-1-2]GAA69117.1 hypothetical protein P20429_3249 [Pseudoalteromonas sp. BSi20429]
MHALLNSTLCHFTQPKGSAYILLFKLNLLKIKVSLKYLSRYTIVNGIKNTLL